MKLCVEDGYVDSLGSEQEVSRSSVSTSGEASAANRFQPVGAPSPMRFHGCAVLELVHRPPDRES